MTNVLSKRRVCSWAVHRHKCNLCSSKTMQSKPQHKDREGNRSFQCTINIILHQESTRSHAFKSGGAFSENMEFWWNIALKILWNQSINLMCTFWLVTFVHETSIWWKALMVYADDNVSNWFQMQIRFAITSLCQWDKLKILRKCIYTVVKSEDNPALYFNCKRNRVSGRGHNIFWTRDPETEAQERATF